MRIPYHIIYAKTTADMDDGLVRKLIVRTLISLSDRPPAWSWGSDRLIARAIEEKVEV
jgi:hypothetical protein